MTITVRSPDFHVLTRPLLGLPATRAWRGYASMLGLDLGALARDEDGTERGECRLMLEWDWRVEGARSILFGSSSTDRRLDRGIASLGGAVAEDLALEGRLPELVVRSTDGRLLRTCAAVESQPRWTVFLKDASWLRVARGRVIRERSMTEDEARAG